MKRKGTVLITAGLLLIAAALSLSVFNIVTAYVADKRADKALDALVPYIDTDAPPAEGRNLGGITEIEYPDYVVDPDMSMPTEMISGVDYIGVITIPSIGVELPVASDWNYKALKKSPCRYSGTAYQNDLVICAHNYTRHFGKLRRLRYGDYVIITDLDGNEFDYEVCEIETLQPDAVEEMKNSEYDLTLFTCTLGGATRITVRCMKK